MVGFSHTLVQSDGEFLLRTEIEVRVRDTRSIDNSWEGKRYMFELSTCREDHLESILLSNLLEMGVHEIEFKLVERGRWGEADVVLER